MFMLISPAKALDETPWDHSYKATEAAFLPQAQDLIQQLQPLGPVQIGQLMKLSNTLSELNYQRFQDWSLPMTDKAKPAVFLFKGDVYQGLDASSLSKDSIDYLQSHLGILSGLYGALKPLDNMLPYRLEMGTQFENTSGKNLYQFWDSQVTDWVNQHLNESGTKSLVNLASNEYFKVVQAKKIKGRVITPIFKDWKNGQYKIISFYAKKARGLMARYAAENRLENAEELKLFDYQGYVFDPALSSETDWVFTRKIEA